MIAVKVQQYRCKECKQRHIFKVLALPEIIEMMAGAMFMAPCKHCRGERELEAY